jgi:hypothetical protein
MLSLTPSLRILVCLPPVDCRKSFDGLAALVQQALGDDPLSGHWFVLSRPASCVSDPGQNSALVLKEHLEGR